MKLILASLLMAAVPQWLYTSIDEEAAKNAQGDRAVVVLSAEVGAPCVTVGGDGEADSVVFMTVGDDEADDGRSEHKIVTKRMRVGNTDDADRGWLGISIGEVPEAVDAQINLDDEGVIILNVLKDSPADKAGLGSHKSGEDMDVRVLREGEEKTFVVTLGSRPDQPTLDWKFKMPPTAEIEEQLRTRGRMLHRGPEGKWVFKDLGDLSALEDLPESVLKMIPRPGNRTVKIWGEDREENRRRTVECRVNHDDGTSLAVKREDEGELIVTRVDEDGEETTSTYATEDELQAADAEAFELYSKSGKTVTIDLDIDGLGDFDLDLSDLHLDDLDLGDLDIDLDVDDWHENLTEWQGHLEAGLEKYEEALEQFRERLDQWKAGQSFPELPAGLTDVFTAGKVKHSFEVLDDGKIEIRTRRGDSDLVRTYSNEADLQQRDPELYEKYRGLMTAED